MWSGGRVAVPLLMAALLLLLVIGGAASGVQSASAQVPPTATFVWLVQNTTAGAQCGREPRNNSDCLHIDPINRRFVYFQNRATPGTTPIAADVRDMLVTQQRVRWSWSDTARNVFVWGNVDRVRRTVRMTMFRRERSSTFRTSLFRQGTPLTLPSPPDPAVTIQDFRFSPRRKIIESTQQLSFHNSSRLRHRIIFDRSPGNEPTTGRPYSPTVGDLDPSRISPLYPVRPAVLPTPVADAEPEVLWKAGTYTYTCLIHPFMTGVIVVP